LEVLLMINAELATSILEVARVPISRPFQKPARILSYKTIQECRKDYCERCDSRASGEPHHVRPRSLGGSDIKENLIQLCFECHRAAHDGKVHYTELVAIVARRENLELAEVCRRIGWPVPEDFPAPAKPGVLSLEEIIQAGISASQMVDDSRWTMGACATAAIDGYNLTAGEVASWFGCSSSQVRELAKTFRAFPDESQRIPSLSWRHHRVAANTPEPGFWIARAADEDWSTRQMQEAIDLHYGKVKRKDLFQAKAEKSFRLAKEVLKAGGKPAEWLQERLLTLVVKV
jgi:hypothetical protein